MLVHGPSHEIDSAGPLGSLRFLSNRHFDRRDGQSALLHLAPASSCQQRFAVPAKVARSLLVRPRHHFDHKCRMFQRRIGLQPLHDVIPHVSGSHNICRFKPKHSQRRTRRDQARILHTPGRTVGCRCCLQLLQDIPPRPVQNRQTSAANGAQIMSVVNDMSCPNGVDVGERGMSIP